MTIKNCLDSAKYFCYVYFFSTLTLTTMNNNLREICSYRFGFSLLKKSDVFENCARYGVTDDRYEKKRLVCFFR